MQRTILCTHKNGGKTYIKVSLLSFSQFVHTGMLILATQKTKLPTVANAVKIIKPQWNCSQSTTKGLDCILHPLMFKLY